MSRPVMRSVETAARPKLVVLLYHRIAGVGTGSPNRWMLTVSPPNFESQIRHLAGVFTFLRLREVPDLIRERSLPDRSICITFDDGYAENLATALPILRRWDAPATFFISGHGACAGDAFWWDRLSTALDAMGLSEAAARILHIRLATMKPHERLRLIRALPGERVGLPRPLDTAELARLADDPLAEIGAHGWSHTAYPAMSAPEVEADIRRNLSELEKIAPRCGTFAYPFGIPPSVSTKRAVMNLGIATACTVDAAPVTYDSDPFALPRLVAPDCPGTALIRTIESLLGGTNDRARD